VSRRSQAFAQGEVKHSWRLHQLDDGSYEVVSKTHPKVRGAGSDEQTAMRAAKKALETAVDKADGL
jgi:hypothetical protein